MTVNKKLISDIAVYTLLIISLAMLFGQFNDKKYGTRIAASDIMQPIAEKITNIYNRSKQPAHIEKQKNINIVNQVLSNRTDIGFLSGNIKSSKELEQVHLGSDALVIIVNAGNHLNHITKRTLLDIYTKKADNWKKFTGIDSPILVSSEQTGDDLSELFNQYTGLKNPGEAKSGINGYITGDTHITGSEVESISFVGRNEGAIGFTSLSAARYLKEQGVPIKVLALDEVTPFRSNVIDSKYPIKFTFSMIYRKNNPKIKDYLNFISTPKAQNLIKEPRFINPDISE